MNIPSTKIRALEPIRILFSTPSAEQASLINKYAVVDVQEHKIFVPIGDWMDDVPRKKLGTLMLENLLESVRGPAWKVLNMTGMSGDDIDALGASVKAEVTDKQSHAYCWM